MSHLLRSAERTVLLDSIDKERKNRHKLLMVAHYCSPYKGSDWRVGWSRAVQAAHLFDVWAITSSQSREDIECYIERNGPISNLTFVYQDVDTRWGLLDKLLISNLFSNLYVNPFSYRRWQKKAYEVARDLHAQHRFDLTHHVNLIGFREPGDIWRLDVPFIWGPVGGTQSCPWRFLGSGGMVEMLKEGSRNAANWLQLRFSPKIHRVLRKAAVVLVANSDGKRAFHRYRPDLIQLLETGLDDVAPKQPEMHGYAPLRILWSGDIQFRKALHLLLQSLAEIRGVIDFDVRILGRGSNLQKMVALAERLGVSDRCQFLGWLPLEQAMAQSEWADVFVFTSLRDTSGNVMLEAMSRGVPVITFDHQGAADIVTEESGIKLPVTRSADAIRRLAEAIVALGTDRERLAELSRGAALRAQHFLWERNAAEIAKIYHSVLAAQKAAQQAELKVADAAVVQGVANPNGLWRTRD